MDRFLWLMFSMCSLVVAKRDCGCHKDIMDECLAIVQDAAECKDDNFWSFGACGGPNEGQPPHKVATNDCCPRKCCELESGEECPKFKTKVSISNSATKMEYAATTTKGTMNNLQNLGNTATTQKTRKMEDAATTTQGAGSVGVAAKTQKGPGNMSDVVTFQTPPKNVDVLADRKKLSNKLAASPKLTCGVSSAKFKKLLAFDKKFRHLESWRKFESLEKTIRDFMNEKREKVLQLDEKIEARDPMVKLANLAEEKKATVDDLMENLFKPEVFNSEPLKVACQDASDEASEKFQTIVQNPFEKLVKEYFENATEQNYPLKATEEDLTDACVTTLLGEIDETLRNLKETECTNKCSHLAATAEATSRKTFKEYDEVFSWDNSKTQEERAELLAMIAEKGVLIEEVEECEEAWKVVEGFRNQLEELKEALAKAMKLQSDAEKIKKESQVVLGVVEENNKTRDLQEAAIAALKVAEANTSAAETAANASNAKLAEVRKQAEGAVSLLQNATRDFDVANEAFKQVLEVKGIVAEILSAMRIYYQDMVVQPMKNMGFVRSALGDESQTRSKANTTRAFFEKMNNTCNSAEHTMGLSEKNLTILCNFESLEDATAEIVAAVDVKRKEAQRVADKLLSWHSDYWNHYEEVPGDPENCAGQMSTKCDTWLQREKKEPAGLRKVIGIFQKTGFYTQYLQRWRFDANNSFLTLSAQFQVSLARANQSVGKFKEISVSFDKALEEANAAAQIAEKQLEQALKIHSKNTAFVANATKAFENAEEERSRQMKYYRHVKKTFDEANNQFRRAYDHYWNTATKGLDASLLQLLVDVVSPRAKVAHDEIRVASQTVAIKPHGLVQSFSSPGR